MEPYSGMNTATNQCTKGMHQSGKLSKAALSIPRNQYCILNKAFADYPAKQVTGLNRLGSQSGIASQIACQTA